ncbi:Protein transport protein Sec61 subunit beta [Apostasia shenzhenica]|uniref:Protein transport protein Sec61 subunit beta n=1 Tax=Apostasia shenzhenica TaxID=1088818 RepID=A0A2I0BFV1_9ASPA|nr:Protein transport protein Sec61 subunit beta [Apostasia shenzhenica]
MALSGVAPPRGGAAATASLRRRRVGSGSAAGSNGSSRPSTMLQFYTDDTAGRKMSPNTVLIMSIGFVAVVAVLHVFGKLYFVRQ